MLRLTRKLLEQQGFAVTAVPDGDAAVEAASKQKFDLLLTDVVMRGMSGPELATRMTLEQDGLKVVFMSGYTGELMSATNLSRQEAPLVEKPFTKAALLRAIQDVLGQ
jgi:CheY-like chemotaxis protein